jgi:hypothetical protein
LKKYITAKITANRAIKSRKKTYRFDVIKNPAYLPIVELTVADDGWLMRRPIRVLESDWQDQQWRVLRSLQDVRLDIFLALMRFFLPMG